MKRAIYEWGAIGSSTLAALCFAWWAASLLTSRVDAEFFLPFGRWQSTQVLIDRGTITINDHRGSKEEIEDISRYLTLNPPLTTKSRWAAPGFLYQSLEWGSHLTWSLRLSLLVPACLLTIAAGFFVRGYVRIRRQSLAVWQTKKKTNSPRLTCETS